tara:strand:- start:356 stop:574 length:219 start_codon:yes stop_codon:yes gene_type:complete
MKNIWRRKMCVGDLVVFDDEFYKSMKSVADIREIAIITEVKELFYCVSSGDVHDLWVSIPDIKKINLDKLLK